MATAPAIQRSATSSSSNTLIGVFLSNCENNVIAGNFIGTDPGGVKAVPNGSGGVLLFYGADRTRIGTDGSDDAFNAAERNVISGNAAGIQIDSNENWVAGNYIGVDATGSGALGNSGNGILIIAGTRRNRIGTDNNGRNDEIERNVISGNHHSGIHFDGSGAMETSLPVTTSVLTPSARPRLGIGSEVSQSSAMLRR